MSSQSPRIGVVGLGYVGLPLALAMHRAGHEVVGVDVDEETVERLRSGETRISDVNDSDVADALAEGIEFTTDYAALANVDGVSICVPTPLRKTDTPDLSFVVSAAERLASVIPQGATVILESTVYPGATEEVVGDALTENGATVGEDVYLAFSPERIDPGNEEYGPTDIPKVLGGVTPACGDHAEAIYEPVFDEVVRVDSATEAELVKLLENTFRAVNIGLINELAQVAHELDVNIWNAIDAAKTKPFGFMPFYPGPGLGGHCIPIDPFYLSWKANEQGIDTRFIHLADSVNREMPDHVVQRVVAGQPRVVVVWRDHHGLAVVVLGDRSRRLPGQHGERLHRLGVARAARTERVEAGLCRLRHALGPDARHRERLAALALEVVRSVLAAFFAPLVEPARGHETPSFAVGVVETRRVPHGLRAGIDVRRVVVVRPRRHEPPVGRRRLTRAPAICGSNHREGLARRGVVRLVAVRRLDAELALELLGVEEDRVPPTHQTMPCISVAARTAGGIASSSGPRPTNTP